MELSTVPALKKKNKKKWIVIGVTALIIIFIIMNVIILQSKKKADTGEVKFVKVTERVLNNTKLISGQVKQGNNESFYVDGTKGKVGEITVKEGQEVKNGDQLFSYDSEDIDLQIKQAKIDQETASLRYDGNSQKITDLKSNIQKLKDTNAPKEAVDPLQQQLSDLQMQQKTADLEKEKGKLNVQSLQKKLASLIVYSSFDGIVQKIDKDAMKSVTPAVGGQAQPFIQLVSKSPFQIQGTLTELQKSQLHKDQTFSVTAKAVPNQKWTGKIIEVSDTPTSSEVAQIGGAQGADGQGLSNYTYKATLDSQDGLAPGYHVFLQVNMENKKMIAVPTSSIKEEKDTAFVYVEENGKLKKQTIKKGAIDGDWTEVLEGVTLGKSVVENPSDKTYDGMGVSVK